MTPDPVTPTSPAPARVLVWDLPTRLFHLLFAGTFLSAFVIAQVVDDESRAFALHMLFGGVMAFAVLLRIVWGFVGTKHARFSAFAFGPAAIVRYAKAVLAGRGEAHVGHNPGSSVAIFLLLALALALAGSGALMSRAHVFEEAHEVLAYLMLAVVGVHVAGVVLHTVQHRENIARAMVDGHKAAPAAEGIGSARPVVAVAFLALTGLWTWGLLRGYDPTASAVTLPVLGVRVPLGEAEEHERGRRHRDDHDVD